MRRDKKALGIAAAQKLTSFFLCQFESQITGTPNKYPPKLTSQSYISYFQTETYNEFAG